MATCPACARPVAVQRATCLYCGARLGAAASPAPDPANAPPAPIRPSRTARVLVAFDPAGAAPERLRQALGLTALEADLVSRRNAPLVHRVLPPDDGAAEAVRLREAGIDARILDEADVRAALDPTAIRGGQWDDGRLALETDGGQALNVTGSDLLLVVRGPIVREYAAAPRRKRARTATLEPGYRFHLHLHGRVRPFEIDPATFAFPVTRRPLSSFLTLAGWISALGPSCDDDSFRRETPALGPEEAATADLAALLGRGAARRQNAEEAATVVDNLRQFRWHSGTRAAFARTKSA